GAAGSGRVSLPEALATARLPFLAPARCRNSQASTPTLRCQPAAVLRRITSHFTTFGGALLREHAVERPSRRLRRNRNGEERVVARHRRDSRTSPGLQIAGGLH